MLPTFYYSATISAIFIQFNQLNINRESEPNALYLK
jgi:hypothetical protein